MARVLVVLGVLLAVVTIIAGYLRWQAFDNETFRGTATELIANDAIRAEIAATSVDALFTNVDVAAELENRLPPDQQQLAGPISAGLRELTDRVANRLLERPRVQALWRESVGLAHQELVDVLRNETTVVRVEDKAVVLNLRPLVLRVGERLAFVGNLSERLPPQTGVITIMDAEQLDTAQDLTKLFEAVATWIWVLPFLLWGIALWLARGRRRIELRAIALGLVVAGVLVLVVRSIAGSYVVDELTTTSSVEEAASEAWEIVTSLLADGAWAAIAIGLVALLGVWLAGDGRSGSASRRWLAPVFARPGLTYGILALLLLLFVWWEPFVHARRPLYVVVTAILLVLGVEALRRATVREFPDAAETEPREMLRPLARLRPGSEASGRLRCPPARDRRARAARGPAREGRPERRRARGGQGPRPRRLADWRTGHVVDSSSANVPPWISPARSYVAIVTPVVEVFTSRSRSPAGMAPSPKSRLPPPTTTGNVQTTNVSTRSWRSSVWISSELPITRMSPPSLAFSAATASATSPFEQHRVSPGELVERPRGDVLASGVELGRQRVVVTDLRPVPAEDLVRPASEQDLVRGEVNLARDLAHHLVPVADRPAAVLEPSVAILVGPAGRLHHAVEGHERRHHQLSHLRLLVVAVTGGDRSLRSLRGIRPHRPRELIANRYRSCSSRSRYSSAWGQP